MEYPRRSDSSFPGPRRVFTAPTYAGPSSDQTSSTTSDGLVETLYIHPSVKVVAFNAGPRPVFSHGKGIPSPAEIEPGSLPWSSQLERTIAAGQFRIYRAPGSVAFLSCGSALQPILPKSQCWCVDESSSKYVLQIRRPQYWRIEVPVETQDDTRRALELREVLSQILQFEKTECPFKRGFTVELPERPQTPVKKRPWTPISRRSSAVLPPTPVTPADITPLHRPRDEVPASPLAKNAVDVLEDDRVSSDGEAQVPSFDLPGSSEERQEGDSSAAAGTVGDAVSALEDVVREQEDANKSSKLAMPTGFQANRSVTAPPQLTLVTAQPSNPVSAGTAPEGVAVQEAVTEHAGSRSPTDSSDGSFHSVESWASAGAPLPPSPPLTASGSPNVLSYPQQYLYVPKKAHQQDTSDLTITPNTPRALTGDSTGGTDSHYEQPSSHDTSIQEDEASSTCSVGTADEPLHSPTSTTQTDLPPATAATNPDPVVAPTTSATVARTTSTSTTSSSSTVLTRRPYMRHRPTASSSISPSRGALNRLPSAADLFPTYRSSSHSASTAQPSQAPMPPPSSSSSSSSRLALVRRLPTAIIHKTMEILFSPPSHLIDLMLKVAARIAAGEWRGYVFGLGEAGERIPVRWDWSDGDDDGEGELGGWGADEDWEFEGARRRGRRRGSAAGLFRMAGAYPDSPEEGDGGLGAAGDRDGGDDDEVPESPSLERRARRFSGGEGSDALLEADGDEDEDERDGANADWTGSLSID
ncbi:hypothetical protein BR93DRAFT_971483 [Coniochaeta sp. PMI_546]|nr:hypothetical protein BR93DRAFT_971483 [Coniochaeta sp. PMI_546]